MRSLLLDKVLPYVSICPRRCSLNCPLEAAARIRLIPTPVSFHMSWRSGFLHFIGSQIVFSLQVFGKYFVLIFRFCHPGYMSRKSVYLYLINLKIVFEEWSLWSS
jgi:hypothetical protein